MALYVFQKKHNGRLSIWEMQMIEPHPRVLIKAPNEVAAIKMATILMKEPDFEELFFFEVDEDEEKEPIWASMIEKANRNDQENYNIEILARNALKGPEDKRA